MWKWLVALVCVGCGPRFAVVPSDGLELVTAQLNGGTLTAYGQQWHGDPYDLADYVTPIAVELYNAGPYEVRVSFVDFALRDERGQRFAAVSPFVPASLGVLGPCAERGVGCDDGGGGRLPDEKLTLLASRGGGGGMRGGGGVHVSAPTGVRGGVRGGVTVHGGVRGGGWGVRGGIYGGFRVHSGYRGFYGPRFSYWSGPLWPLTSPWVVLWGPSYYPAAPSQDVLFSALPEGVLAPGASIAGFLYFQRATSAGGQHLDLSWNLHDAQNSADMGTTHVALDVIAR